jgi:hypothetical protein
LKEQFKKNKKWFFFLVIVKQNVLERMLHM